MQRLDPPEYVARDVFLNCIRNVRAEELRGRLEAVADHVERGSDVYHDAARRSSLHEIVREAVVGGQVTTEEMGRVYSNRMAKKGAPGRYVYEAILHSAPQERCPLCVQRMVTTLDHHLPQAHYPLFAVNPLNLVPACADCNKAKLASYPENAEEVPLHPYYDDIDGERWLGAAVVHTAPAAMRFFIQTPGGWNPVLAERLRRHFDGLDLAILYAAEAAEELVNIRSQLVRLHVLGGGDLVRAELQDRAASCEAARRNGWRTACYRAWADSDWFCNVGFGTDVQC